MIKLSLRENMKSFTRFLLVAMCIVPFGANCAPVPSTRGNNLTAYNGASGVTNNNNWNALMNVRSGSDAADMPVADFGNCNAVILRCASPKCANGGCTSMDVTNAIVAGCVQSNESCAQYGDELVQYISAQLVASSTAKANAAQNAAAAAAAQQSAQQMAAMQAQMQQMQTQMAQQNAETVAQLQDALAEQKQLTAQAIADAAAARETAAQNTVTTSTTTTTTANTNSTDAQAAAAGALTTAQQIAAQNGVSADLLAREQITGQILSSIENADAQLKTLKTTMTDAFDYAGCDSKGNNCNGPKRVKAFKEKAMAFFDPYENVLDELYDALITAQAVGVDITDIYMMLNGSCNVWGQYLCSMGANNTQHQVCENVTTVVDATGKTTTTQQCHYVSAATLVPYDINNCKNGMSVAGFGNARGGHPCVVGQIIPPEDDIACTLQKMLTNGEEVQRNWLWTEDSDTGANIRVGCMSSALETSKFFRNRKKGADIDIEILERIIEQDAPSVYGSGYWGGSTTPNPEALKYCAVNEQTYTDLQKIVALKTLPSDVCVSDSKASSALNRNGTLYTGTGIKTQSQIDCENAGGTWLVTGCNCPAGQRWDYNNNKCVVNGIVPTSSVPVIGSATTNFSQQTCTDVYKSTWNSTTNKCNCDTSDFNLKIECVKHMII